MAQGSTYNPLLSGVPQSAAGVFPNGNPDAPLNPIEARNTDSVLLPVRDQPVVHNYQCDGPAPGNLLFRWIHGSIVAAHNRDPRIQVVQYNEDTYILRQNVCVHWEAPFTYLLFGNDGALLIDTGATPEVKYYPLRPTVDAIIERWARLRGRKVVPLTIALTSAEDIAQNRGVVQFVDRDATTIVPMPISLMRRFYGMTGGGPDESGRIDLGGRIIEVLPTPGTHKDGLSFYDPYCDFLFCGDFIFPGKINIGNDHDYVDSISRLKLFSSRNSVKWIMGGHVDMMFIPAEYYPRFATFKPYERILQLKPDILDEILQYSINIKSKDMTIIRPEFVLLNGVSPDQWTPVRPEGVPEISAPRPL